MEQPASETRSEPRIVPRERRRIRRAIAWVGVLVVAPVAVWCAVDLIAERRLAHARERFAQAGYPKSWDELRPPVPEEENSAALLAEAVRLMERRSPHRPAAASQLSSALFGSLSTPADPQNAADAQGSTESAAVAANPFAEIERLTDVEPTLVDGRWMPTPDETASLAALFRQSGPAQVRDLILAAATRVYHRPPMPPGDAMALPDIGAIRRAGRFLDWSAEIEAIRFGGTDRCTDDLIAMLRLSRQAGRNPSIIENLTAHALAVVSKGAIEHVIEHAGAPARMDELLAELRTTVVEMSGWGGNMLHAERLGMLDFAARHVGTGSVDWLPFVFPFASELPTELHWPIAIVLQPGINAMIADWYDAHWEMTQLQDRVGLEDAAAWEALTARFEKSTADFTILDPSVMGKIISSRTFSVSELRLVHLALAAYAHRARTGEWPTSSTELGAPPHVLIDPWSKQPLRYRAENDAVIVYSFGADADDDGGRAVPSNDRTGDGDLVVRLEWREPR